MSNDKNKEIDPTDEITVSLTKAEEFIRTNQQKLLIALGAVVVVVAGFVGYNEFIAKPKGAEAATQIFMIEKYFRKDSFNLVLQGDGMYSGAPALADQYGGTPAGNLARYYAGMSYLHTGDYENAVKYLEKYKGNDMLISYLAAGALGDAYVEVGNYDAAVKSYKRASAEKKNEFLTPIYIKKMALVYEEQQKFAEAASLYQQLWKEYRTWSEREGVEKLLARAEAKAGKTGF
jgi:tetratricopeptide (TPR) repeat protein